MQRTEWYKNAVVYQIYPFSFMDANNDGWGDIEGIISKLDYLKQLGITAIWFSPLYKSPDYDYGYDISDYRDIDSKFGTIDDFKNLLAECHAREIKVIMDIAINHSSIEHEWFKKALKEKTFLPSVETSSSCVTAAFDFVIAFNLETAAEEFPLKTSRACTLERISSFSSSVKTALSSVYFSAITKMSLQLSIYST